jgi:multidrug resistance protein, MATE family
MDFSIYKTHYKKTFLLAYPVVVSQLGHIMVGVADSVMVGQTGAKPLAAVALANSLFTIVMVIGLGLSYGITPLIASADGRNDRSEIAGFFRHGLVLNVLMATVLWLALKTALPLIYHIGQPEEVAGLASSYLSIMLVSLVPLMTFLTYKQFAEGLSNTSQAMYISVSANILNVVLNYVFIYGKLGFAPMGIAGAAIATLISRLVMAIAMMVYIYRSKRYSEYAISPFAGTYHWPVFKKILGMGLPVSMQMLFEAGAFSLATVMSGWYGATSMAAHQIALNMASVTYMMIHGLSSAATVRVGNQVGRNDWKEVRLAGFSAFHMVIAFMAICGLIFVAGRHFLPTLYIQEVEVIEVASLLMFIAALFQLSDGVQVVGLGALRGIGDVKVPTAITLFAYWIVGLPVGYMFGTYLGWQVYGIWMGLLTGLSVAAVFLFYRFNTLTRARYKASLNGVLSEQAA